MLNGYHQIKTLKNKAVLTLLGLHANDCVQCGQFQSNWVVKWKIPFSWNAPSNSKYSFIRKPAKPPTITWNETKKPQILMTTSHLFENRMYFFGRIGHEFHLHFEWNIQKQLKRFLAFLCCVFELQPSFFFSLSVCWWSQFGWMISAMADESLQFVFVFIAKKSFFSTIFVYSCNLWQIKIKYKNQVNADDCV